MFNTLDSKAHSGRGVDEFWVAVDQARLCAQSPLTEHLAMTKFTGSV